MGRSRPDKVKAGQYSKMMCAGEQAVAEYARKPSTSPSEKSIAHDSFAGNDLAGGCGQRVGT
jgi:hypothetical protein